MACNDCDDCHETYTYVDRVPVELLKSKQRVHYLDELPGHDDCIYEITHGESGESPPPPPTPHPSLKPSKKYDYFRYKSTESSNDDDRDEHLTALVPYNQNQQLANPAASSSSPSESSVQPKRRYVRNPCDSCGHHYIPVMTHPISPLAKSQNNLDVNPEQSRNLLMVPSRHHNGSNGSLALTQVQTSRRPSGLLQDILTRSTPLGRSKKEQSNSQQFKNSGKATGSLGTTTAGSTVTIYTQGGGGDGAKCFQARQSKLKNRRAGNDAISAALSATYCKLLVLLGVCLPVTEVISNKLPNYVYQGFYVYLYSLSILFVIFLYGTALRQKSLFNAVKTYHEESNNVHLKRRVTHFGSFYLRVGAIAFAIGTMVYSGLEFGQFFELNGQPGCRDIFLAITPILRMILCIVQVQFIFLNTTYLDMASHKVTCRFGLMHMVATNLCEWLYVLVEETKHEIFHIRHHTGSADEEVSHTGGGIDWTGLNATMNDAKAHNVSALSNVLVNVTAAATQNLSDIQAATTTGGACARTNIMGALVQEVSPFLFPCTIEYSLICAVILYEMWKTVKSIPDIDRTRKTSIKPVTQKPAHHFSVDCSQSHKGLFFGILVIVMTIISMIMYFVLYTQPGFELVATQEVTLWETIMYFLCGAAVVAGMFLMRDLRYVKNTSDEHHSMALDNMLLVVAQTGVYLYGMFSILGSYFSKWDTVPDRVEGIVCEVFGLAQTSLQTMFILHASHRRCKGAKQVRRKPGREIITFLLVANIAIWFVNTLIKGRAVFRSTHLVFFGVWGWTIITHIAMPLAIFYRFHSTICLFEVWKISYKAKAH